MRIAVIASAAMAVLVALAIISLRYWILPDIAQYRDRIAASVSGAIGNQLTIGKIDADWQGLQPRLRLADVRILDEQGQPALALHHIDGSLSWMSLLAAEVRLARLEIDRPELLIRRDPQGRLFVGGVALSREGSDGSLANWLLRQSRIVVRDALIVWVDEQRTAAPLVLQQVNLHVDSFFNRHRFALRALPPKELASPLDVRGEFRGTGHGKWDEWQGQTFAQIDFTDVTVWRHWLNLPESISSGRGAVRAWADIESGKVAGITADLALQNVKVRLGESVPEMLMTSLRGRAAWKDKEGSMEISTRRLAMRLQDGIGFPPTDSYFRTMRAINGEVSSVELRASLLQLETLAALSEYVPLEEDQRTRLKAYSPRGRVADLDVQWRGAFDKPENFRIKGRLENISLRKVGTMPGFHGLSLEVDGTDESGRLSIDSRGLVVDAAGVMREPLSFSVLVGQAGWRKERNEIKVTLDNAVVVNDDLAGNVYGSYQTKAGTRGVLDLTASLTRGDVRSAARYTPLIALHEKGNDWLNGALKAGHTEDFRVRIKGNLSRFPLYDDDRDVLFEIGGHAKDVTLEFSKTWPRIENIAGEFWIRGNRLEVRSSSATMLGASLRNVTVALPNMRSPDLPLEINGEAVAASSTFLHFIQQSPVRGYIRGLTDGLTATGNGQLRLFSRIPLREGDAAQAGMQDASAGQAGHPHKTVQVSGTFLVQDNDIDLGQGIPLLRKTRGAISFTESGMNAKGLSAEILGGPASIDIQTGEGGEVHAKVQGHNDLDALRKINRHPLLSYLRGGAAWDADIVVVKRSARVHVTSDLKGIVSTLPQPFAKAADEAMPLRFEKKDVDERQDLVTARLGNLLNARVERREERGEMVVDRGTVNFGDSAEAAATEDILQRLSYPSRGARSRKGIWLVGSLPEFSIEGWEDLMGDGTERSGAVPIAGANLHIGELTGYGQIVESLQIDAVERGGGMTARLTSGTLNGEVTWLPYGYEGGGKLSAYLRNLYWVKEQAPRRATPATDVTVLRPDSLPAIDISIEDLRVKDQQFGRLDLVGHPDGDDWRMRRLNVSNPDGSLSGDGFWRSGPRNEQTQLNLQLKLNDVGKTLARYGYPNTVKGGSGRLAANLTWDGGPAEFEYSSLTGTLRLDTGKGRFLKMEPGAGKLLSILSLQALPSRITLDFTDVFSGGFQFDAIKGNASIDDGVINSQDLQIIGSAAKVTMKGGVDLNSGAQDLNVKVYPTLGDSVSLIGAFAAGPAVGVGTLIVSKVLGDPLDKLVSFEYNVTGSWSEPNVVKVVREPVPYK